MHASSSSSPLMATSFLSLLAVICISFLSTATAKGFSVDLIHRDSPFSPLYNPSSTPISRIRDSFNRSFSRAAYFLHTDIHSEIIPNSFEYLMPLTIGTPPTKTLAIVDTGSDLIWLQCTPCEKCYAQNPPLFNPAKSSSYSSIACSDTLCSSVTQFGNCSSKFNDCSYYYAYGDRSYVVGDLATETLWFDSADDDSHHQVHVENVVFGCTHKSNGSFDASAAGLVGLGGGQLSLITQLGDSVDNKFSYCLPSINSNSSVGKINFGAKAVVNGPDAVTTDLIRSEEGSYFFLHLEQISVAGDSEAIEIKKSFDAQEELEGNIIIDSGTTLTLLEDEALQPLITKLSKSVQLPQVNDPQGMFSLCFDVSEVRMENANMPNITFHFSGADVVLSPFSTFLALDEKTLCLAMVSSEGVAGGISIFGNVAQQNFNIGYDLSAMKVTFEPADCTKV